MIQHKVISSYIILCLLNTFSTALEAQQSRVDSVIQFLNKSIVNNQLDSANLDAAIDLLYITDLTDNQVQQVENTVQQFKKWEKDGWPYYIQMTIFFNMINVDYNKAINYGKLQIEKIDRLNSPVTSKIKSIYLSELRIPFRNSNRQEEGFRYFTQKINDYKIRNDSTCLSECYFVLSGFLGISGLMDQAIYHLKKSNSYIDTLVNKKRWVNSVSVLGGYYLSKGDKMECIKYSRITLVEGMKEKKGYGYSALQMAKAFILSDEADSALHYLKMAKEDPLFEANKDMLANILQVEALYKIHTGALAEAEVLLQKCGQLIIDHQLKINSIAGTTAPDYYMALVRIKQRKFDEAIVLLKKDIERLLNNRLDILRDYKLMAELYTKAGNSDKATETYAIFIAKQDSLLADQDKYRSISFEAEEQLNEKEHAIAQLENENKLSAQSRNFTLGIAVLLLILAGSSYYRFRSKKKANVVLEKTLTELKATQSQLIQSEKMASLGELTAGIAHEIQNPLNFVNNFSELNTELIAEMKAEIDKGDLEEVKAIANDIADNEQKILHHGRRADAIVKGMLQHSRSSSGLKEPTDINALADEYLRLAYHGQRARDKSFNVTLKTDFDASIGKINVVPQDIGRVILNLITNAFYAVAEKQRPLTLPGFQTPAALEDVPAPYEPTVTVSTKKAGDKIEIRVADNGNGIPAPIMDKIFQPFFTTKPTGQGTGLGLSLSYDIVKAHGGELKVETMEGNGSEFLIRLPGSGI